MTTTAPANTFATLTAIGQREDLVDVIYNIDPVETPGHAALKKNGVSATAILHEWQIRNLAAAGPNANWEGFDFQGEASNNTIRVGNRAQIMSKEIVVSKTLDAVNTAGRARETAEQVKVKADELKRDIEYTLFHSQTPQAEAGANKRQMRAVPEWFVSNVDAGIGATNGSAVAARGVGTLRPITEEMVTDQVQSAWTNGGNPTMLMVSPSIKVKVSKFNGNATRFVDAMAQELRAGIDIYVSDFGRHEIVANRFSDSNMVFGLDTTLWATAELRPMSLQTVAQTGDNNKAYHVCEFTIESRQEAGSFLIADVE